MRLAREKFSRTGSGKAIHKKDPALTLLPQLFHLDFVSDGDDRAWAAPE